jgi:hypothetical protein
MRSFDLCNLRPFQRAIVKKWCRGLLVFCVSLGLFALAGAMATSNRLHQPEPAATVGMASGGGHLVPVF